MHTENSECTHTHTCSLHENYTLRTHDLMVATKLAFLYEEPNSTGLGNKRLLPSPVERRGRRGREGGERGEWTVVCVHVLHVHL